MEVSIEENYEEFYSWKVYPKSNVAIKTCDHSFFVDGTGIPKGEVCDFWGVDYEFRKKEITFICQGLKYDGYIETMNNFDLTKPIYDDIYKFRS